MGGECAWGGEWSLDMRMHPGPQEGSGKIEADHTVRGASICALAPGPTGPAMLQTAMGMTTRGDELSVPWVTKEDTKDTICLLTNFL